MKAIDVVYSVLAQSNISTIVREVIASPLPAYQRLALVQNIEQCISTCEGALDDGYQVQDLPRVLGGKGTLLDVFKSYARTLEEQYKMTLQEYIPLQNAVDAATYGYAERRNITIEESMVDGMHVVVFGMKGYIQPLFVLYACQDGSFSWKQNISLAPSVKEELPAYYQNCKMLRVMIEYVAKEHSYEINAKK